MMYDFFLNMISVLKGISSDTGYPPQCLVKEMEEKHRCYRVKQAVYPQLCAADLLAVTCEKHM